MPNIFCIRAGYGAYADHFYKGGYAGIHYDIDEDLSLIKTREEITKLYLKYHPDDKSNLVIGQQVGQIYRFLIEIQPGDFIVTPTKDTEYLYYGIMQDFQYYFEPYKEDGCPYVHRRFVKWFEKKLIRSEFSVPVQNTLRSSLTVYTVDHKSDFFDVINRKDLIPREELSQEYNNTKAVLNRILELGPTEFEILIQHLLTAMGFEESEHRGKVGDGGVDVYGELNVFNMAKIKLYIQAKRYKLGSKIDHNTVRALRQSIPFGGQGAFITTAGYSGKAREIAQEAGFPRIGLIDGKQLVDILTEHWNDIPPEFQEKLGLKLGLVTS